MDMKKYKFFTQMIFFNMKLSRLMSPVNNIKLVEYRIDRSLHGIIYNQMVESILKQYFNKVMRSVIWNA